MDMTRVTLCTCLFFILLLACSSTSDEVETSDSGGGGGGGVAARSRSASLQTSSFDHLLGLKWGGVVGPTGTLPTTTRAHSSNRDVKELENGSVASSAAPSSADVSARVRLASSSPGSGGGGGGGASPNSTPTPSQSPSSFAATTDDWLREWLSQLVVTIPDQTVSQGFVKVTLTGLTCGGFAVQSLTSAVDLSATAVGLSVGGAGCECSGTWASGMMRGGLTAVVQGSGAQLRLSLTPPGEEGLPQLPTDASVDSCTTTVRIVALKFTGSGAVALRALSPLLKAALGRELDRELCSSLAAAAADRLSGVMKACDLAVAPRLRQPPPLPDPLPLTPPEAFYDLRRAPAVALAGFLAASFARADGRLRFGLNTLVDVLTASHSHGAGVWAVDSTLLPGGVGSKIPPLAFDVPAASGGGVVGRVTVAVHGASLRGLDTANVLEGPTAVSPTLLALGLGAEWINLTATATVNVTTVAAGSGAGVTAPPLVERVTVEASVRSPLVRARVAAALDEAAVAGLTLEQRAAPGCLAAAVGTLGINALAVTGQLHRLRLEPERPGGLEGDVDGVVADVAALLAGRYSRALTAAASAAAGGPGRDAANARIAALLDHLAAGGCPAPDAAATRRETLKARVSFVAKWVSCACIGGAVVAAAAAAVAAPCLRRLRRLSRLRRAGSRTQSRDPLLRRTRGWDVEGRGDCGGSAGEQAALVHGSDVEEEDDDQSPPILRNVADSSDVDDPEGVAAALGACADEGVAVLVVPKSPGDGDPLRYDGEVSDVNGDGSSSDFDYEDGREDDVSLACSPRVPQWVKWALPLALVGNTVLFISSNTAVGASVMLSAQLMEGDAAGAGNGSGERPSYPNVPLTLPPLFDFTLANSVKDMWQAKVYPLSVLIAVFSGGWPYLKLALMLVAWVVPPRLMEAPRRGRLLGALDALGKWSLIDAFVMTLFMVAFRFHLETPPTPVRGGGNATGGGGSSSSEAIAALDVTVDPKWGFYSFLLATVLSLVLGHVTLGWHRAAFESAARGAAAEAAGAEAGRSHRVALWRRLKGGRRYRLFAGASVATCLAASAALVVSGARATSLRFDFKGLAGAMLGPSARHRSYSIMSLASGLPGALSAPNTVGVVLIQAALYIFALAMPLAQLALLAVLWLTPLPRCAQLRIATAAEVAGAWAALDVFLVAALAAVLQIRQFAAFIVGDSCDAVDAALRYVASASSAQGDGARHGALGGGGGGGGDPLGLKGDNVCFDVDTKLEEGCWILVPAAVVAVVIGHVVTEVCQSVLRRPLQELALTPRATATPTATPPSGTRGSGESRGGGSKGQWRRHRREQLEQQLLIDNGNGNGNGQSHDQRPGDDDSLAGDGGSGRLAARLAAAADELDSVAAARDSHLSRTGG